MPNTDCTVHVWAAPGARSMAVLIGYFIPFRGPRGTGGVQQFFSSVLAPPPFFFCVQFPFLHPHKCIGGGESLLPLHSHSSATRRIEIGFCQQTQIRARQGGRGGWTRDEIDPDLLWCFRPFPVTISMKYFMTLHSTCTPCCTGAHGHIMSAKMSQLGADSPCHFKSHTQPLRMSSVCCHHTSMIPRYDLCYDRIGDVPSLKDMAICALPWHRIRPLPPLVETPENFQPTL